MHLKSTDWQSLRWLQITLALFWLIDAVLQAQPKLFGPALVHQVILSSAAHQPDIIASPMHWAAAIILLNPALFNAVFVAVQVALAGLILWPKTSRWGLILSVFWGMGVWFFGEGAGQILTGNSILMGAPGAALLYAILAAGLFSLKSSLKRPRSWLIFAWATVWLMGAVLQLSAHQVHAGALSANIKSMAAGAPSWQAAINLHASQFIQRTGWIAGGLVVVQFLIGALSLAGRFLRQTAVIAGILLSLIFWPVGQNFGALYSGIATDLNSAPLMVLLGLAVLVSDPGGLE